MVGLSLEKSSPRREFEEVNSYIFLASMITSFVLNCYSTSLFLFFSPVPPSMGSFSYYIVPFKRFWSSTCWPSIPLFECLSHRTPPQATLCIGTANIALFRGLLHINAARKLAAKP